MGNSPQAKEMKALKKETKLTQKHLKQLREFFEYVAEGKDTITKSNFLNVFGDAGSNVGERLFLAFDKDKNGTIDFREFAISFALMGSGSAQDKFFFMFTTIDLDGNGFIEGNELRTALRDATRAVLSTLPVVPQEEKGPKVHNWFSCSGCQQLPILGARSFCDKCFRSFCEKCATKTIHDPLWPSHDHPKEHLEGMKVYSEPMTLDERVNFDIDCLLRQADSNGDGKLSVEEFCDWAKSNPVMIAAIQDLEAACSALFSDN